MREQSKPMATGYRRSSRRAARVRQMSDDQDAGGGPSSLLDTPDNLRSEGLSPQAALTLQGVIGNQAVQRLLALRSQGGGTGPVVQRMKVLNPGADVERCEFSAAEDLPDEATGLYNDDGYTYKEVNFVGNSIIYERRRTSTTASTSQTDQPAARPDEAKPKTAAPGVVRETGEAESSEKDEEKTPSGAQAITLAAQQPSLWNAISDGRDDVPPPLTKAFGMSKAEGNARKIEVQVKGRKGTQGQLEATYDADRGHFEINWIHTANIPDKWVQTQPPLVPDRGTPLTTYLILRAMKLLKVPREGEGSLLNFRVDAVEEVRAVCEYNARVKKGVDPNSQEMIDALHPYLYSRTPLLQAGYRIIRVSVSGGQPYTMYQVADNMARRSWEGKRKDKADKNLKEKYLELAEEHGIAPDDKVVAGFNVDIQVTPKTE